MRRLFLLTTLCLTVALAAAASALAQGTEPTLDGSVSNPSTGSYEDSLSATVSVASYYDSGSGDWFAYAPSYYNDDLTALQVSSGSSPITPTIVGEGTPDANEVDNADTVNIFGGLAYVVSKNKNSSTSNNDDGTGDALSIFNVAADPSSPAYEGSITDSSSGVNNALFGAYGIAVSGNDAYVAAQGGLGPAGQPSGPNTGGNDLAVIDVTDPTDPTFVASLANPSSGTYANALYHPTAVAISGNYAFVTSFYGSALTVVDISNPSSPRFEAILNNDTTTTDSDYNDFIDPSDVTISGNYAYVINQNGRGTLTVVDIQDPTHPQVVGIVSNTELSSGYRIRVDGDFAYVSARGDNAITAVDISNPANPQVVGSLVDGTHLNATTGLDLLTTNITGGPYVVASSPYLSGETNYVYPPFPSFGNTTQTNTGTISSIQIDPAASFTANFVSKPAATTTQTAANFTIGASDAVASLECGLDGAALSPCTTDTTMSYANLSAGPHTLIIEATGAAGQTAGNSYTWTVGGPSNSAVPTISGTAKTGNTLTASTGTWSGTNLTYAYQWGDCNSLGHSCTNINGATSSSYTVQGSDVGHTLEVKVTATDSAGSSSAISGNTSTVVLNKPANTTVPTISGGAPMPGIKLTASTGTWSSSPTGYSYQWEDCKPGTTNCQSITHATSSSYKVTGADIGYTLRVKVTASNTAGSTAAYSQQTATVTTCVGGAAAGCTAPPGNTARPTITGTIQVGQTLFADAGTWSGSPTSYDYQWELCNALGRACSPIAGANGAHHSVTSSERGGRLAVLVTAIGSGGSSAAASSKVTASVASSRTRIVLKLKLPRHPTFTARGRLTLWVSCNVSAPIGATAILRIGSDQPVHVSSARLQAPAKRWIKVTLILSRGGHTALKIGQKLSNRITLKVSAVRATNASGSTLQLGASKRITLS